MSRRDRIGLLATTVITEDGITTVTFHSTPVVTWVRDKDLVILDTGGWKTVTTKARMNQAANEFGLPYHVGQKDGAWFVTVTYADGSMEDLPFPEWKITFEW